MQWTVGDDFGQEGSFLLVVIASLPCWSRAYTQDIGGTVPVFWSGLWEGGWQRPDVDQTLQGSEVT